PVELRAVVADDRDLVTAGEAERRQSERDEPRLLRVAAPGIRLPDAVVLLPDRDLVRRAPGVVDRQLGEGVEALISDRNRARGLGARAVGRLVHQGFAILQGDLFAASIEKADGDVRTGSTTVNRVRGGRFRTCARPPSVA